MELTLQEINSNFISLPTWEVRINNEIISHVVPRFLDTMKQQDPLFNAMFRRVFFGGSYYDGLKVGNPEEFDLDLLLDLPRYALPELVDSPYPGFVQVVLNNYDAWMRQPEALPSYSNFRKLLDNNRHVNTDKVLTWMEGLVQKSLNNFPCADRTFRMTFSKSGPALTLHIFGPTTKLDVDLVPCFVFRDDKWPRGFRRNPVPFKPEFFVVPKKSNYSVDVPHHWRLSFQEQERVIIDNKLMLKPTVKLLKKMRDANNDTWISSYYIKTIFLHACQHKDELYWKNSLSYVFLDMLKEYQQYIQRGEIPYFWNERNNLFNQRVNRETLNNLNRRLYRVIRTIERNPNNPEIIAKFLLTPNEYGLMIAQRRSLRFNDFPWALLQESTPLIFNDSSSSSPGEWDLYCILSILFIYALYCVKNGEPSLGSTIILLEALYLSYTTFVVGPFSSFKYVLTFFYILCSPINFDFACLLGLLYCGTITIELFVNILETDREEPMDIPFNYSKPLISLGLIWFWVCSYVDCRWLKSFSVSYHFGLKKTSDAIKLTLQFSQPLFASLLTIDSTMFKTFFLLPVIDFIFFGYFTMDHYLIILTSFMIFHLGVLPDFNVLLIRFIFLLGIKSISYLVDKVLTNENISCLTLMAGATLCKRNPYNLKHNAIATVVIGGSLLLTKGVAQVLSTLSTYKYMAASMLLSCITDYSIEIL